MRFSFISLLAKAKIKQKGKVPLGEMACSTQKGKVPLGEMACSIQSSTRGNGLPDHPRTRGAGVDRTRRRTRARASLSHPRMVGESGARLSTASPAYHPQLTAYHSPSGPTYLLVNRGGVCVWWSRPVLGFLHIVSIRTGLLPPLGCDAQTA